MKATEAINHYEDIYGDEPTNTRVKTPKKKAESESSGNRKSNKFDKKNAEKAPWKHF